MNRRAQKTHFNVEEKAEIIKNTVYNLNEKESMEFAKYIDGFTFQMIKQLSESLKVISKGH